MPPAPTPVNVPIVDFSACSLDKNLDLKNHDILKTCNEVFNALKEYGCLYLINHGLPIDGVRNCFLFLPLIL